MAPKPTPSLPACGYIVVYLGLKPEVLATLRLEALSREYTPVFKEVGGRDDEKRAQSRVKRATGAIGNVKVALKALVACLDSQWIPSTFSYLKSEPNGGDQQSHQDYPSDVIQRAKQKNWVPASMVLALEEGTKLRVYDGCLTTMDEAKMRILDIPVGFCVIFRGDLAHGGVDYANINHRLHCYLSYAGLRWEPDVVTSVLPPHFECKFCPLKLEDSNRMRQHRRYCKNNPKAAENEAIRRAPPKETEWTCNVCERKFVNASTYRSHVSRGHDAKKLKTD